MNRNKKEKRWERILDISKRENQCKQCKPNLARSYRSGGRCGGKEIKVHSESEYFESIMEGQLDGRTYL